MRQAVLSAPSLALPRFAREGNFFPIVHLRHAASSVRRETHRDVGTPSRVGNTTGAACEDQ